MPDGVQRPGCWEGEGKLIFLRGSDTILGPATKEAQLRIPSENRSTTITS